MFLLILPMGSDAMIRNPVLRGFHHGSLHDLRGRDVLCRKLNVRVLSGRARQRLKDLANWECVSTPLADTRRLNMLGNVISGGIWAPCLSYCDGIFYLVFTDVKTWKQYPLKDAHNYIVTARDIRGPWTEPVYMNSIGFDTSLFHDGGGRKYFVNAEWDYRKPGDRNLFGHTVTEIDPVTFAFIGETRKIFTGTDRGLTEGPHIYKKDGWYYLLTAEGGTFYEHAATVARSREISTAPMKCIRTSTCAPRWGARSTPCRKTGHTSWYQGPDGRWFLAFLCGRPADGTHCILGRETGVNEIVWENDWPYLKNKTLLVDEYFEGYGDKKALDYFEYRARRPGILSGLQYAQSARKARAGARATRFVFSARSRRFPTSANRCCYQAG